MINLDFSRPWICLICIHGFDDELLKVCICFINETPYWYMGTQKCNGFILKQKYQQIIKKD